MQTDNKIKLLLMPSWVVNFIGISLAVLLTAGVIVLSRYEGSSLRQQIFEAQTSAQADQVNGSSDQAYHSAGSYFANNKFLSAAPLMLAWAAVGLVVYYFAIAIGRSFGEALSVHDQLEYVHISRQQLLRSVFIKLAVRIAAVLGWFAFLKLSLAIIIPYGLACANVAAESLSLTSVGFAALAVVVFYADVWIHSIFLRLIVLKPRVFGL